MLRTLRASAQNIFAKILLGILVLSFGIWGIGDIFRHGGGVDAVATVGKTPITTHEFQSALRQKEEELQRILGKEYRPELIKQFGIDRSVLDHLITDLLVSKETTALGITPSDDDVLEVLRDDPTFKNKDGHFDKSIYFMLLSAKQESEQRYVSELRSEIAGSFLRNTFLTGVIVPDALVQVVYQAQQEQRTGNALVISLDSLGLVPAPSEKDIASYYKAHAQQFSAPEYRTVSYVALRVQDIQGKITVSEEDITRALEERKGSGETRADIIKDLTSKQAQEALYKLVNVLEDALAGGATLEAAADKVGEKVKSFGPASHDGKSQDGKALTLPPYENFLNVAFATADKDHSQAVMANDGSYFLLHVDNVMSEHVKPLAEVKSEVVAAWKSEKKQEQLTTTANAVASELSAGKALADVLAHNGVHATVVTLGKIKRTSETASDGPLAKKPLPAAMVREFFRLHAHENTHAYPTQDGGYMIALLAQVIPAPLIDPSDKDHVAALDAIRSDLKTTLAKERMQQYVMYLGRKYGVTLNNINVKDEEGSE